MTITTEKLQELIDKVLFFAMSSEYKDIISEATSLFTRVRDEESIYGSEFGLNQWLVHDYQLENGAGKFPDLYKSRVDTTSEEAQMLEMINKSRLSIFQMIKGSTGYFLKDILTRQDYEIIDMELMERMDETAIHLFRLYPYQNKWFAIPEGGVLDRTFLDILYKGLMDKYGEYCRLHGPQDLDVFVYNNPLLVYKLTEIVEDIEMSELGNDEDFTVYQSLYLYQEQKEIVELMETLPGAELSISEEGVYVYRMIDEMQLAEIILFEHRMEIECVNESDRKKVRGIIQNHFGDRIAHVRDEVLDMDQLLEGTDE